MLTEGSPHQYHWNIWTMLDFILGPERADVLSKRVYVEFLGRHPWTMARLYTGTIIQGVYAIEIYPFMGNFASLPSHPRIDASPRIQLEIAKSEHGLPAYRQLDYAYTNYFRWLQWAIAALATAGLPFSVSIGLPARTRLFLLSWAIALHQVTICAVTAGVYFNYISISFLMLVMASGIGTYSLCLRLADRAAGVPAISGRHLE
jgi:hypothetical protein